MPIGKALDLAAEADLDLVEVAPMARPPVCKLMDYGKFKYESAQKAREARRNQALTVIKEMKLRPKIDSHDYETKKGHVERFLKQGDKVKVTIMFRGREQSRPELGFRLLQRLAEDVSELGFRRVVTEAGRSQHGHGRRAAPQRRHQEPTRRSHLRASAGRTDRVGNPSMPKNKTHSGIKKRVKITGSGKLRSQHAGMRHNLEKKPSTLTRRLTGTKAISTADTPRVKKLLGR